MLIGFSVSNYMSFNETQSISFNASKIIRHKSHLIEKNNKKILKSGLIFGANASGKSNLIKAIDFSKKIILNGSDSANTTKSYFRIKDENYKIPGIFEYRIIVKEKEFSYGFALSYETKEILGEWLVEIDASGKEVYYFNRETDDVGNVNTTTEMVLADTNEKTMFDFYLLGFGKNISEAYRKKTILSDIALRTGNGDGFFGLIKDIYTWFNELTIIFPTTFFTGINEWAASSSRKDSMEKVINYFDTGIEAIESTNEELDFDKIINNSAIQNTHHLKAFLSNQTKNKPFLYNFNNQIYVLRQDDLGNITYNKLLLNHGNNDDLFEFSDESDGTKRLFELIPIYFMRKHCPTIIIDEIDRSLHTILTRKFFELFFTLLEDTDSQIIATSHDSNLLDLDLFRQDEIWFVERQNDHSSKLYSLNKFKERYDKKIEKEYLLGRYGAIPLFENVVDFFEDLTNE